MFNQIVLTPGKLHFLYTQNSFYIFCLMLASGVKKLYSKDIFLEYRYCLCVYDRNTQSNAKRLTRVPGNPCYMKHVSGNQEMLLQTENTGPTDLPGSCYSRSDITDSLLSHDDVMKWKSFPHYWPFVKGIHRWPVDSFRKGPVMRTFDVPLLLVRTDCWNNTRIAGDQRGHDVHMISP